MSQIDDEQTSNVTYQQQQTPLAQQHQDQRLVLIRNVSKYPRLYKNEFLNTPFLHRHEKQQLWDKIAQESLFEKTEDAKSKWRSLINYLRQHLDSVAQKKLRRYIPTTDNPEDKFVQLTDWNYYKELEFLVPYVEYSASKQNSKGEKNRIKISPSEIDMILEGLETDVDKTSAQNSESIKELKQQQDKEENVMADAGGEDLTEDDLILKEYFENMLKATLKLPRFHQNRIKQKLLDCVNEQKEF